MPYCSHCGDAVEEKYRYCGSCGNQLKDDPAVPYPPWRERFLSSEVLQAFAAAMDDDLESVDNPERIVETLHSDVEGALKDFAILGLFFDSFSFGSLPALKDTEIEDWDELSEDEKIVTKGLLFLVSCLDQTFPREEMDEMLDLATKMYGPE